MSDLKKIIVPIKNEMDSFEKKFRESVSSDVAVVDKIMHYNLVKASNRRYLEELKNRGHEMKPVYDAVNIMQDTEWVINKPIYEVILKLIQTDSSLGKLPTNPQEIELPVKPVDIETNKESLVQWKRQASLVYKDRAKSKSKYIQVRQILEEARLLLNRSFFYPYQLDFRSRIYPKPAMLSPQGADYSRALLKFKYGKQMKENNSFDDFAIAGAGLYGEVDKEDIQTRLDWVKDRLDTFIGYAKEPLNNTDWDKADKPLCYQAWCFEIKDLDDEEEYNFKDFLIMPPAYYKNNSDEGVYHFYKEIITKVPKCKIILYNFEKLSSFLFKPELVKKLASDFPKNIIGVKDSSYNLYENLKIPKDKIIAPAPSPNRTHVDLSFQSKIFEYFSDPIINIFLLLSLIHI